jgi:CDP-diacylglycerol pyrophosphatase
MAAVGEGAMASIAERLAECRSEMRKLVMATEATHEHTRRVREVSAEAERLFRLLRAEMKAETLTMDDANLACEIYREIAGMQYAMAGRVERILSTRKK